MALSTIFIDGPPEYRIVNGGVQITAPSGEFHFTIQIPFEHFIVGHIRALPVYKQVGLASELDWIGAT